MKEVRLFNRTKARADELQAHYETWCQHVVDWSEREDGLEGCGLVVNSTTLGMSGSPALDLSLEALCHLMLLSPILSMRRWKRIYWRAARRKGCRAVDGLGMLLHQAVPGF